MGLLFERFVRVSFGVPGGDFTVVEGLTMSFDVQKNLEKSTNKASIKIFNLNETSCSPLQQEGAIVRLDAGYGESPDELFTGQISRATPEKLGRDIITTIESGDGQEEFRAAQVNKSLAPGATGQQVIETIASALQLGTGAIKGIVDTIFQNGITLSGDAEKKMDEITAKMGLEWSIQDGKIQILAPNEPSEDIGVLLTPETGLLDAPIQREGKSELGTGKFLEFRALLRAQIKPGVRVRIVSDKVDGFFKIRKATYAGNSRQGPFEVRCEATEVPSGAIETSKLLNVPAFAGLV